MGFTLMWAGTIKELEQIVHPKMREETNDKGMTPQELFTEEHKDMKKVGEEWMKNTATSCTVVGALIVIIMFAAAFTVPGEALFEITLTRFSGDILPATDAGIVLSIADSLVGLFASGCQPSSTNDPFGLRRISYGLVQVLVEKDRNLDLKQALELAAEVQHIKVDASTIDDVHQFVTRRLEQFLRIYSTENKELYHWGTVSISVSYIWPIVRVKPETPPHSALGAFTAEL
uniref:glycine--tRNA ligase n=1 Tax=Fagus sylvatica TaxID=28930 RepID=A0A2N9IKT0_FAGSY